MSQYHSRNLATPQFDSWMISSFPARPGSYYTQRREASSNAQEAWTPYDDGVPAAPPTDLPLHGSRQRDSSHFNRPWRNDNTFESGKVEPTQSHRQQQRERPRSAAPSPPPKRSKVPGSRSSVRGLRKGDSQSKGKLKEIWLQENLPAELDFAERGHEDWEAGGEAKEWEVGFSREQMEEQAGELKEEKQEQPGRRKAQKAKERATSDEFINANYLSEKFPPIDPNEYQNAPSTLFENPKAFLWDSQAVLAKSSFITKRGGKFRCNLVLSFRDGRPKVDAVGDSMDKVGWMPFCPPCS